MFAEPMNDATFGLMLGFGDALADAQAAAAEWKQYAHEVEGNRDVWMAHARKLEAELADLMDKLAVERAHSEGLKAIVDAFKETHPDSPLMRTVGTFKSEAIRGCAKRLYHSAYESRFDDMALASGIADPASRRYQ